MFAIKTVINRSTRHIYNRLCMPALHYSTDKGGGTPVSPVKKRSVDMEKFPVERIRNFSIIAHIDHGKSTLADRLLEVTGTITRNQKNEQVLDRLQVERERGITVKAQTASLLYHYQGHDYLLNLIDTPGHVDFSYEVSRSLAACQGVILLIDANQGVQAQTVANFYLAFEAELTIIAALNKIDLKNAKPEEVTEQVTSLFDINEEDIFKVSAKLGTGVEELLTAVIEKIPPPTADSSDLFRALLFDSCYDHFRGAACSVAVLGGTLRKGDRITSGQSGKDYEVQEVGIMRPEEVPTDVLYAGQVGYIYAMMKNAKEAMIGDTLFHTGRPVPTLAPMRAAKPMVFAGFFPIDQSEHPTLSSAIEKLTLNDSSVTVAPDSSSVLGNGWRLGFLGLLHMDVFSQRLEQEHDASVIITTPNVPYRVKIAGAKNIKFYGTEELEVLNPCHLPDSSVVESYEEPMVLATIITPHVYLGDVLSLIMDRRGEQQDLAHIDSHRVMFKVIFPLQEVIVDFFDDLKSVTSGYASFDYEDHGYRSSNLVKLVVCLNGTEVDELTQISPLTKARTVASRLATKLKQHIPPQLFEVAIQVKVGGRVLARENIKALRKDVLAKCYGGDITRKMKLLRRQAEGKRRMRRIGNVDVPKDAFIKVITR